MQEDGRFVLVPCESPEALYVIEAQSHEVAAIIPTGPKAHGADVSADGAKAFVTNVNDGTVSVIDLMRRVVVTEVKVGDSPAGVDFIEITP